jgi:toxin YoeB
LPWTNEEDLEYWVTQERKTVLRVLKRMEAVLRDPFEGIGKPERPRHIDPGVWSRRVTYVHQLVDHVADDRITLPRAHYHNEP